MHHDFIENIYIYIAFFKLEIYVVEWWILYFQQQPQLFLLKNWEQLASQSKQMLNSTAIMVEQINETLCLLSDPRELPYKINK